jgi:hypothetical protein
VSFTFGDEHMPEGWAAKSITKLTGATHFAGLDGNAHADVLSIINERRKDSSARTGIHI